MNEIIKKEQNAMSIPQHGTLMSGIFSSVEAFELAQRLARMFTQSSMVPQQYRGQDAMANCLIALDMAGRLNANPLMVMQNLNVVEGHPAWSSKFLIATVNSSGRFSPLRYEVSDPGDPEEVTYTEYAWVNPPGGGKGRKMPQERTVSGIKDRTCRAWAYDLSTGDKLVGPEISIVMAIQERWFYRAGSKWQTMPELMLRYRAASFWTSQYAPELSMGIPTAEEAGDIIDVTPEESRPAQTSESVIQNLNQSIKTTHDEAQEETPKPSQDHKAAWPQEDPDTGDLVDARGLPWDARFHAISKRCVADGSWRMRRGADPTPMKAWEESMLAEKESQKPEKEKEPDPAPAQETEPEKKAKGVMLFTAQWFFGMVEKATSVDDIDEVTEVLNSCEEEAGMTAEEIAKVRIVIHAAHERLEGEPF